MGFPLGYSELLLPRLLLQFVFFLGFVRRLISWAFNFAGLGDLLDSDGPWPDPISLIHHHHHDINPHKSQSFSAMLIQETLPIVSFRDLPALMSGATDSCAVCLYEFEADDKVRRLSNCRHVFHRSCLDRWMEHDQRTCPLCRTPLIPDEMQDAFNDRMWASAVAGFPSSYSSPDF